MTLVPHLTGRWKPLILTAAFTGLRASELRALRWEDVDLKRGELHVRRRADAWKAVGAPKSKAGTRTVPLPPLLVAILREWKLACPKGALGLAFPNGAGKIVDDTNILVRGLQPAMIKAGLVNKAGKAKYTGMHALRHFYASWCINRKADGGLELPLKVVQARPPTATGTCFRAVTTAPKWRPRSGRFSARGHEPRQPQLPHRHRTPSAWRPRSASARESRRRTHDWGVSIRA